MTAEVEAGIRQQTAALAKAARKMHWRCHGQKLRKIAGKQFWVDHTSLESQLPKEFPNSIHCAFYLVLLPQKFAHPSHSEEQSATTARYKHVKVRGIPSQTYMHVHANTCTHTYTHTFTFSTYVMHINYVCLF